MPRLLTRPSPPLDQRFVVNTDSMQARGLVAWWPTVGANDGRLPGYAGQKIAMVTAANPSIVGDGTIGQMLSLNGTTHYATAVGAIPVFQQTTPFSVSCWVATTDTDGPILSNFNAYVTAGWQLDINAGSFRLLIINAVATAGRVARTTSTSFASGALFHVVTTYAGASSSAGILIYVNGYAVAMTSVLDTTPGTLVDFGAIIGGTPAALYAGTVGDVRVYNRVLLAQEIFQMYAPQTRWELYRPAKWRTLIRGSFTTNQNLAGTTTSSGALTKQDQKPLAGAVTSAGALTRQAQKAVAGTITSAGALTRQAGKALAGVITPAGALAKQIGKAVSGSITSSGVLTKVKVALLNLAGTITSSGALTRQPGKALAGTITSAGALARQGRKAVVGTMTPVGIIAKQVSRPFAGTITSSGALTRVKVALLNLAGTITSAGVLTRNAGKGLSGSITPAGSLARQAGKVLAGTVGGTGVLSKQLGKLLAGSVGAAGALARLVGKSLIGTVLSAGSMTRQIGKALAGLVGSIGVLGRQTSKLLSGTMALSGGLAKQAGKAFSGLLGWAGSLVISGVGPLVPSTPGRATVIDRVRSALLLGTHGRRHVTVDDGSRASVTVDDRSI